MDLILQDIRHAVRALRRAPGFTLAATLTLALGIGATTAIYTVVDGVLLRPLPFAEPGRLVALHRPGDSEADVGLPDVRDWRAEARTLSGVAVYTPGWAFDLTGTGEPAQLNGSVVEPAYFGVLGTSPLLGRVFTEADGDARLVVLSEGLWRARFGADTAVLGRSLTLSDVPYTVIGVMPAGFDWLQGGFDLWAPVAAALPWAVAERGTNNFEVIGRLAPGVTLAQAHEELTRLTSRLASEYPRTNGGKIITLTPLRDYLTGSVRDALVALLVATALVLLIGCANLSNLLLARAAARRHELAVRRAIGAGGGRLVRQLLTESLVLALLGGSAGLVLAVWGTDLLLALAPAALPRADMVGVNGRVLGITAAVSLATGLLFGMLPALWARRQPAAAALSEGRGSLGTGPRRSLDALVTAEVALAFLLLAGAGLMLRTFANLRRVDIGFDPARLLTANLVLPESRYGVMEAQTRAVADIVRAVNALPGVEHAAFVVGGPLDPGMAIGHTVRLADRPVPPDSLRTGARSRPVAGDFFATMRLPVVEGRALTAADNASSPYVAVVNESFARFHWPGGGAVGQRVSFDLTGQELRWMTIVGVTRDVPFGALTAGDNRAIYFPYEQRAQPWIRFGKLMIRSRGQPEALERAVREAVWSVDPALVLTRVRTMEATLGVSMARERFTAQLTAAFAMAALLAAAQGIYGVLAFAVTRRRREMGVRLALGARPASVVGLVLRQGVRRALLGIAIGLAGALALGRLAAGLLYQVAPNDPLTLILGAALLGLAATAAAAAPALRAARVNPIEALRSDDG